MPARSLPRTLPTLRSLPRLVRPRQQTRPSSTASSGPAHRSSDTAWIIGSTLAFGSLAAYLFAPIGRGPAHADAHSDDHAHAHAHEHMPKDPKAFRKWKLAFVYAGAADFHALKQTEQAALFDALEPEQQQAVLDLAPVIDPETDQPLAPTHPSVSDPHAHPSGTEQTTTYLQAKDLPIKDVNRADREQASQEETDVPASVHAEDAPSSAVSQTTTYHKAQDIPMGQIDQAERVDHDGLNACNPAVDMHKEQNNESVN